jgi:hypothetical protein
VGRKKSAPFFLTSAIIPKSCGQYRENTYSKLSRGRVTHANTSVREKLISKSRRSHDITICVVDTGGYGEIVCGHNGGSREANFNLDRGARSRNDFDFAAIWIGTDQD